VLRGRQQPAGPDGRGEHGFTLVELLVAMTVLMLVVGALLGALVSGLRTERRASTRIDDEQTVRLVLAQLTHDVRGAGGILPGTAATLPIQLDLELGSQHIRWTYAVAATSGTLSRSIVDDQTNVITPGVSVGGLANGSTVTPFTLLGTDGSDLSALPGMTPADVAHCVTAVQAQVVSSAHPPTAPFAETVVAQVRGRADRRGCP